MNKTEEIISTLERFKTISLDEMKDVRLMNRIDTKYVVPLQVLADILSYAAEDYSAQVNKQGSRLASYHTVYLDTSDKAMYQLHETGRKTRSKIRIRTYLDTNESFIEIKTKNNRGRTAKKRILFGNIADLNKDESAMEFVKKRSGYEACDLSPHVENQFNRITLVNSAKTERLTIDLGLSFHNIETGTNADLHNVAIIELKRDGLSFSPMKQILREMHIHEGGFSKYCIGCALTNTDLRQNNLKVKINKITKINSKNQKSYD